MSLALSHHPRATAVSYKSHMKECVVNMLMLSAVPVLCWIFQKNVISEAKTMFTDTGQNATLKPITQSSLGKVC